MLTDPLSGWNCRCCESPQWSSCVSSFYSTVSDKKGIFFKALCLLGSVSPIQEMSLLKVNSVSFCHRWFTTYPRGSFFFLFFKLTGGNPRVICTVLVYWMLLLLINCGANFNIVHVVCCKEYFYLIVYFLFLFISPCYWYAFWSGTNYTWLERDTVTSWGTGRVWFCSVTLKSVTSVCQLPMLKVSVIENIINVVIKQ